MAPSYPQPHPPRQQRTRSSGSFHAGAPIPSFEPAGNGQSGNRRHSSVHKDLTFPPTTASPRRRSAVFSEPSILAEGDQDPSPLPVRQLVLLALLALAEQTALNSISPYLPSMVASFPGMSEKEVGFYIGVLASSFALAQLSTNFLWGYLSDYIGRKPVLLLGTSLLAGCFALFGFCRTYWQLITVHVAMGLLNGNAAVVPTVLGEVTDRSNQSTAFIWLPVIYSLGGVTGPALGGLLAGHLNADYPYLAPNAAGAVFLTITAVILGLMFQETLDNADSVACCWKSVVQRLHKLREHPTSWLTLLKREENTETQALLNNEDSRPSSPTTPNSDPSGPGTTLRELLDRNTILVLVTYLVFQLSNISFNSLYPIFAAAAPPTGRGLSPDEIGLTLSVAGLTTMLFQVFLFQPFKTHFGNLGSFRIALVGLAFSMTLMPFIGHADDEPFLGLGSGQLWLYVEMGSALIIKNICAIGGLSCVMLLITNCAPSPASLGRLNGFAQTLSAAGRSIGPFLSGSVFSLATHVSPKGEALAWGLFGGITMIGWFGSLAIRGRLLESDDWISQNPENPEDPEAHDGEESPAMP